jgi:hypothetical protein
MAPTPTRCSDVSHSSGYTQDAGLGHLPSEQCAFSLWGSVLDSATCAIPLSFYASLGNLPPGWTPRVRGATGKGGETCEALRGLPIHPQVLEFLVDGVDSSPYLHPLSCDQTHGQFVSLPLGWTVPLRLTAGLRPALTSAKLPQHPF